jgi:uncharacterized membrane protein
LFHSFVGNLGWQASLPLWLQNAYLGLLAAAVAIGDASAPRTRFSGRVIAYNIMFAVAFAALVITALYFSFTSVSDRTVGGLQGRYWSAYAPILAGSLACWRLPRATYAKFQMAVGAAFVALMLYLEWFLAVRFWTF